MACPGNYARESVTLHLSLQILPGDLSSSMVPDTPSSSGPPPPYAGPPPPRRKRSWLLFGCGSLLALMLIIVATVAITIWWIQRPIKPVTLSAREKATVDE